MILKLFINRMVVFVNIFYYICKLISKVLFTIIIYVLKKSKIFYVFSD